MVDTLLIVVLVVVAIILFLLELLFIPGTSIAGISALACIVYANYYAFVNIGTVAGFITLGVSLLVCIGSIVLFFRSKMLDRIALTKEIDSTVDREAEKRVKVGDVGVSVTRLAQIGTAQFGDDVVEVKSVDGFLDENTRIVVCRIDKGVIMVKKLAE